MKDDGIGMTEEALASLRADLERPVKTDGQACRTTQASAPGTCTSGSGSISGRYAGHCRATASANC